MESTITAKIATTSSNIITKYPFFGLNYWFGTPSDLGWAQQVPFEIITTLVFIFSLLGLAFKLLSDKITPPEHKFLTRVVWLTLFFGPFGYLLIVFRYLGVVWLSARFFWAIWFVLLLWSAVYLLRYQKRTLPQARASYDNYQLKKRYFPKKKKR